ncbi:MAG: Holliday junction branch migration protein RuvA [Opitutales bacterium]|nr:Holliday junction branch migration protein RuvA [Opitutales bacterium]
MIVGIRGKLVKSTPLSAVLNVNGIFYEVNIPITTAEKLGGVNAETFLYTLAIYREDSQTLYGFASVAERDFFKLLVEKVSGIGPKIALNIMSRMSVETLRGAIESGDVALLSKCQGIGKKTAERLIVELRGAFGAIAASATANSAGAAELPASKFSDAVAALAALGYKLADADKAVRAASAKLPEGASTEEIIKTALRA